MDGARSGDDHAADLTALSYRRRMDASLVVSYLLAVAGTAVVWWTLWQMKAVLIHRKAGTTAMLKLFAAHNASRARKLCAAAPMSFFTAVGAAIDAALASKSRDPVTLAAAIDPAFAAKAHEVAANWRRLLERGLLGAILVFGGVGLALSNDLVPLPLYIAGGFAALFAGWLALRRGAMADSLEGARLEILPVLVTSIVESPPRETPAADAPAPPRPSRAPAETAAPRAALPDAPSGPSLRAGVCPLCAHATIMRVEGTVDPRFYKLVCRGCGYAQEFADLARLDA